jgi:hypothetical protein
LWEIATFFFVMFLSPASFVFGLFLGISPEAWLAAYLKYVVVFITLSFFAALGGLEVATSYWLISHGGPREEGGVPRSLSLEESPR